MPYPDCKCEMTPFQIEKRNKPRPGTTSLRGSIRERLADDQIRFVSKEENKLKYLIVQNYIVINDRIDKFYCIRYLNNKLNMFPTCVFITIFNKFSCVLNMAKISCSNIRIINHVVVILKNGVLGYPNAKR